MKNNKEKYKGNYIESQIKAQLEIRKKRFPLFDKPIKSASKGFYLVQNFCEHGDLLVDKFYFNHVYKNLNNDNKFYCDKCKETYFNNLEINEEDTKNNREILKKLYLKGASSVKESYIKKYYYSLYLCIIKSTPILDWNERTFLFKEGLSDVPKCAHDNCNNNTSFSGSNRRYMFFCEKHSYGFKSKCENDLFQYISSICQDAKKLRIEGSEFDIYVPGHNIAFEFNGLYWHSDEYKSKAYHLNKMLLAKKHGIKLVNVWEDDWREKNDLVKSIISYKLNNTSNKIYARDCVIKNVSPVESNYFLSENHLQGSVNASIRIGLFFNDELVSLMTFGKRKISNKSQFELLRFCSKKHTIVIGASSKLFKHFLNNFDFEKIISYANCDISDGKLYSVLGFKTVGHTGPNYWWSDNIYRYNRNKFVKHKLDESKDKYSTETDIMRKRGFKKIWGTGNIKFEYIK